MFFLEKSLINFFSFCEKRRKPLYALAPILQAQNKVESGMSLQNRAKKTDFFLIYRTPYHLHLSRVNYEPIQWPISHWLPSVIRDLTIRQRRHPWKRRWKIDFASFQSISRFNQVAQLLKRREFMLELKRGERARVQTEMVKFIALSIPFSGTLKFGHFTS